MSRINGTWDLRSIVGISPLPEVDALRIFKRLKERAIIRLKESWPGIRQARRGLAAGSPLCADFAFHLGLLLSPS